MSCFMTQLLATYVPLIFGVQQPQPPSTTNAPDLKVIDNYTYDRWEVMYSKRLEHSGAKQKTTLLLWTGSHLAEQIIHLLVSLSHCKFFVCSQLFENAHKSNDKRVVSRAAVVAEDLVVILQQLDDDLDVVMVVLDGYGTHDVGRVLSIRIFAVFVSQH